MSLFTSSRQIRMIHEFDMIIDSLNKETVLGALNLIYQLILELLILN